MNNKKIKYVEPADYFPKEIREKYGLGEYADSDKKEKNNSTNKEKNNENNHS